MLCYQVICCQDKNGITSYDFIFGTKLYENDFYNQLKTLKNFEILQPINYFGISGHEYMGYLSNQYSGVFYYQTIPQNIVLSDSVNCKITGKSYGIKYGYDFFGWSESKNCILSLYLNLGRMVIKETDSSMFKMKNQFVSPGISIEPRIVFNKITCSIIAEYNYDVSGKSWKRTSKSNNYFLLDNFNQSGINLIFSIGFKM